MNTIQKSPENMELHFENQLRIEKEFEKIELVADKLTEKYKEYKELQGFVAYLKGMEKLFAQARIESWTNTQAKEELVKNEIHFFSLDSGIDEDVFKTIRDDFGMVYITVKQVHEAADKLMEKYAACADCLEFIGYMKKISLLFLEAQKEHWDMKIIKENMCKSRIAKLSADGHPELQILEQIRMEFDDAIVKMGA
ncbi:MAG TPA: hypothetical protein DCX32_03515 [Candidatus Moranbacteria bacterium]|nr:MAG: hypothetical protein UW95_C0008G0003 [Parcubacteria group bacterium GW2011_GWC1_45_14]HAV11585.1 hypothetical protein [Candidatus Moranbacteria bacterium]